MLRGWIASALFLLSTTTFATEPNTLVTGLKNPESVAIGPQGRVYVTVIGEFDKDGDGAIVRIEDGKVVPFVSGLNDPKGLAAFQRWLFVTDKDRVLRIDEQGKTHLVAGPAHFPVKPRFLNDIHVDPESGVMYVSDSGDLQGQGGAVYRITPQGKVSVVVNKEKMPELHTPNGLALDSQVHLLLADFGTGILYRIHLLNGKIEKLHEGFGGADGLVFDHHGQLFVTDWKNGKVWGIARPDSQPVLLADHLKAAADCCYDPQRGAILVPDMTTGDVVAIPAKVPGFEVDSTPLPLETEVAFPNLKWTGWQGETETGQVVPLRPIVLTHAGDGSHRVFVATQHGVIHVFPNDPAATQTAIFLDIQDRVRYSDDQNEEGFLGLAFHPKFKENGEFFVFYTPKKERMVNVVSRFRVRKDDPTRGDPDSEEVVLRFKKPFWNHDGGTILFGPDGYLYITHGDGGAANDPFDNGQKTDSLLGKILRIDVDSREGLSKEKNYAIPKDNPFVDRPGYAPEIWALGLRNVWRMAFDRGTGRLWAGDVGQNLWEEINLIEKGGNYGWNRREGLHPFGGKGTGPRPEFIDPIWEYHHDLGKSITGGGVYRGKRLPELEGHYLYADYVSGKIWALLYDETKRRVVANRPIRDRGLPILSFGEDEAGDMYLLTTTTSGQGIYRFTRSGANSGSGGR